MCKRYNKEELAIAVSQCLSFAAVCRYFGKAPVGGNTTNIKLMCKRWDIDTSHMTGQVHNKGKPARNRKLAEEILVLGTEKDHRMANVRLIPKMLEVGVEYKCNGCGLTDEWNGKPIVLEIDHIDEQYWNNTKENLQFLCPNCHSQKTKQSYASVAKR